MLVGTCSSNAELGIDAKRSVEVLCRLYDVLVEERCTPLEACAVTALLQENLSEQAGVTLVTPKVRRRIKRARF